MDTKKRILEAIDTLNGIPYINSGGCGISALALARYIHKDNPNIKLKFGFMGDYGKDENGNRDAPCHVVLMWNGHRIDTEGIDSPLSYVWYLSETVSESDLVASLANVGSWNSSFDRERELPVIAERLGIDLSDVPCQNPHW